MRRFGRRNARGGQYGQRAAAWTPARVSGLFAWWDAAAGITVATGVSAWVDTIGGYTLAQGTGANQPTYSAADSNMNNLPSLTFDASNDRLVCTSAASVWKFLHTADHAIYFACRHAADQEGYLFTTATGISSSATSWSALGCSVGARLSRNGLANSAGAGVFHCNPTGAGGSSAAAFTTNAKTAVWQRYVLNTSFKVGSSILPEETRTLTGSASSADPPVPISLGYGGSGWGEFWNGQISEVLVYNAAVGDADHALIVDYLETKYGI